MTLVTLVTVNISNRIESRYSVQIQGAVKGYGAEVPVTRHVSRGKKGCTPGEVTRPTAAVIEADAPPTDRHALLCASR